ncbi:cell division protein DivIC [Staphylococcus agnetis]|uniref:Cell division protein DivIC n=1 Tax=Staphylococcus agnetis TaxID=985762 RepID=A0A2T4MD75_9STAP|nr:MULTISPECIES: septum formation initiator family protein [Staphylococcus]ALN77822.1 septum formation initiator family protein [Staphylococcus agnetis]MCO4358511.1 septum formation initiator family protein [Staphylococcus agnetis]MCO4363011.1 septum formation initiator family protein [Staphylococcus agnetis]MDG4944551.1 septum formation initiator family protein [Staphylococcus agnetis]NHM74602.1 septum formation initiator family protein [Staphylococcus sp. 11007852]
MNDKVQNIGNQYTSQKNAKKRRHEQRKRIVKKRILVFGGILLAIIAVMLVLVFAQMKSNSDASNERQAKEEEYQKLQDKEIELKEQLNNLNDPSYIEKVARDEYYLSNDGEIIFKLPEDQPKQNNKKK